MLQGSCLICRLYTKRAVLQRQHLRMNKYGYLMWVCVGLMGVSTTHLGAYEIMPHEVHFSHPFFSFYIFQSSQATHHFILYLNGIHIKCK